MTTHYEEKKCCGICGSENKYTGIGSTNTFGSADLDTRPPEMYRSTIFAWVQRCPVCGYCNSDVSKSRLGEQELVNSADYRTQLNDPTYPTLANSLLCNAILDRAAGSYAHATWNLIRAAWVCDDTDQPEQAATCRKTAADMLELARQHDQKMVEQDQTDTAILVDLLRRSGQPKRARQILATQQNSTAEDVIGRVRNFQRVLLERNDVSCHTIEEALENK